MNKKEYMKIYGLIRIKKEKKGFASVNIFKKSFYVPVTMGRKKASKVIKRRNKE